MSRWVKWPWFLGLLLGGFIAMATLQAGQVAGKLVPGTALQTMSLHMSQYKPVGLKHPMGVILLALWLPLGLGAAGLFLALGARQETAIAPAEPTDVVS